MMNHAWRLRLLFCFCAPALCNGMVRAAEDAIDFNRDIRPILSNNCFQCHGPDVEHREADLRLDDEADAKLDRDGYFVIKPGDPDQSEFVARIVSDDPDSQMPPPDSGKSLTEEQIVKLEQWVEQGAKWQQHWAYIKPQRRSVPAVVNSRWSFNSIDRFIAARLEREGLQPSTDTDRVTLIRRLSFDLTGLPPSPLEVDRFQNNLSSKAYRQQVDRLLASPAFGERLASYWLDLVRFADTVGYHGDQDHSISPYRDYVIDAFNDNKPFDQFTREQLAGDLLPNSTVEQKIATGYNRLLQTSHEGGVQPREYLAIYAADRVRNVSAVWMGGTLGCAQCHDHKYDPYTSQDFYAMSSFFADVDEEKHFSRGTNNLPTARPPEIEVADRVTRRRIATLKSSLEEDSHSSDDAAKIQIELERLEAAKRKSMVTVSLGTPRTTRLLPRGNWLDETGPIMTPAVPEFMGAVERTSEGRATRLDLANWLTDVDQAGLFTARVFVNRLWFLFFGQGLAPSLDDLGGQGLPPVHPELLDNLAWEFVDSGWDIKHVVRLMVSSHTYCQSSLESDALKQRDPNNHLFARQARFRLPSESIRDNALSISGLLVNRIGGPSVKPYQPAGYYRHLNFPQRKYQANGDFGQFRRGVYMHWQRQFLHPMLKAFDAPSREECTAMRPRSNTPLAALSLLNDPTFVEAARVFAGRILIHGGDTDDERLNYAFRLATSRSPVPYEKSVLQNLLSDELGTYRDKTSNARKLVAIGQAPNLEGMDAAQLAAWTTVARALLNLSETITRN